jgi:hypothetical protein
MGPICTALVGNLSGSQLTYLWPPKPQSCALRNGLPTSLQHTGDNGPTPAFEVLWRNAVFAARKTSSRANDYVLNRLRHHS